MDVGSEGGELSLEVVPFSCSHTVEVCDEKNVERASRVGPSENVHRQGDAGLSIRGNDVSSPSSRID